MTGIGIVAVVVVEADSPNVIGDATRLWAWQVHPFGAVEPEAPASVITTLHAFTPRVNVPAVAPPVVADTEHPEVVNFVPALTMPERTLKLPAASKLPRLVLSVLKLRLFAAAE